MDFAIAVNGGTDYELTLVFLTQDIDMARYMNNFVPIDTSTDNPSKDTLMGTATSFLT